MVFHRKRFFIVGRKKSVRERGILIIIDILGVDSIAFSSPAPLCSNFCFVYWSACLYLLVLFICLSPDPPSIHSNLITGESYHDLANRLWPVMLEMEREVTDLVIIAHQSVLRVLCAYFMENSADVRTLFLVYPVVVSISFHGIVWAGFRGLICAVLGYWFYWFGVLLLLFHWSGLFRFYFFIDLGYLLLLFYFLGRRFMVANPVHEFPEEWDRGNHPGGI